MNFADQCNVVRGLAASMRSQWWSADRIRRYQEAALVGMMRHAAACVPFYRRLGIPPASIASSSDLQRFPLIGKRDVQREPAAFLASGFEVKDLHASRTSGSSGQPTTTYFCRDAWLQGRYTLKMRRVIATSGWPLLRRVLIVSEQRPEALPALADAAPAGPGLLYRQRHVSIHVPVSTHLAVLARYRPHIIYAFPSYLLDLISVAGRSGATLPRIPFLYTSSEVLSDGARRRIETAFSGRLFDVYGSTEFKEVAWQCRHDRYHVNFESVYVEPQATGQVGPVVLSALRNRAMPLLRFAIGDEAVFGAPECACGRASPQLLEFAGREGDMITLPGQRRLSPYLLTTVIESEDSILQYRIIQTGAIEFRVDVIVRIPGQSMAWGGQLCARLAEVAGDGVRFAVREVDSLERAPGGKRAVFMRVVPGVS